MTSRREHVLPATNIRRTSIGAAIVMSCLVVRIANASPSTEADALIDQGVKLRLQGKTSDALELFKRAHALAPSARTLAQLGLAEGALQQWIEAEDHLVTALAAHDTPWIENPRNREAIEHALAAIRGHIGRLTIVGPAGAHVMLNGKPVGRLPLGEPVRVAEGTAQVSAQAPGRRPVETRIGVAGGSSVTVTLELPPILPPSAATPQLQAPASLALAEAVPRSRSRTWAGASLLALSAAAIATGIVWMVVDGDPACSAPSGTVCRRLYDTKTQGWLAIAAGASVGVAGGILLWRSRDRQARVALGPAGFLLATEF